jgi:inosine-uridine nucleoside N-ribohydrolase
MRTTLEVEDDVLAEARDLARQSGTTVGHIVSDLLRTALRTRSDRQIRNGVPLFKPLAAAAAAGANRPDLALVNTLRDEE